MSTEPLTTTQIRQARGARVSVDPFRPYAYFVEPELSHCWQMEPVTTVFLTNRECPFTCVYCDLWKHTTTSSVPVGAIPAQIDFALGQLPSTRLLKLYNSGNFFDPQAIPPADYSEIIARARQFDRLIVENHPRLVTEECVRFRDQLGRELEIALGLETVHPDVLPRLNKQMTLDEFAAAVTFLHRHGIATRAFILLRPPFLGAAESAVDWAVRSAEFAAELGMGCSVIIPTRGDDGLLKQWQANGDYSPPTLVELATVMQRLWSHRWAQSQTMRVFADLWDLERLTLPDADSHALAAGLRSGNETQAWPNAT